jgi:glycine betaine transporter
LISESESTGIISTGSINIVFTVSMVFCVAIGAWGLIDPDGMTGTMLGFTNYLLNGASWYWLLICTGFLILSTYLAFGPYGKIRLGRDDEAPEFSTPSWIAMLFAGGMGSGLLFWGVAEPMYHYYSPPGEQGLTPEAARTALAITNLHWGLHAWAIYGVCALVIAYFCFRKDAPSMVSTPIFHLLRPILGDTITTWFARFSDIVVVLAVVFGLAGALAAGVLMTRAGMTEVFGTPADNTMSVVIIIVMAVAFITSASTGVDKGIKILSNINMALAVLLMLFVLFAGPTSFLFGVFVSSIGDYLGRLVDYSFRLFTYKEDLREWVHGWTLTYLIWWIAWGPFVGIFIARISRGRTIREFCMGVILIPTLFSMLWFAVFGGAGLYIELHGAGGLADIVFADVTQAFFTFLNYLPLARLLNVLAIALVFIFLVTSADSGTFVIAMMTTNGNLNPDTKTKVTWGVIITAITIGTLLSGSVTVAKAMAITGAIPFTFIVLFQLVGFFRALREETPPIPRYMQVRLYHAAREKEAAE